MANGGGSGVSAVRLLGRMFDMKKNILGFMTVVTVLLALLGAIQLRNIIVFGAYSFPLILDRQTVVLLKDQQELLAEANEQFARVETGKSKKK